MKGTRGIVFMLSMAILISFSFARVLYLPIYLKLPPEKRAKENFHM
jgi:hypothetical protein